MTRTLLAVQIFGLLLCAHILCPGFASSQTTHEPMEAGKAGLQEDIDPARPRPLPYPQAVRQAVADIAPEKITVTKDGVPLVILHDLDGDGSEDIFLLAIKTRRKELADLKELSEFSRLFDQKEEDIEFSVEIYLRKNLIATRYKSIPLGTKRICTNFEELGLRKTARLPFGIALLFPTPEGREHVWVLFSSAVKYELFTFLEKADVKSYAKDIDGNGYLDLITFEDVFEDSTGYETYITWYRWEGTTFRKYRGTNIVRNMRAFFQSAKEQLLLKGWQGFFSLALTPQDAAISKAAGTKKSLPRIFKPAILGGQGNAGTDSGAGSEDNEADILMGKITDIVFPEVLENPFTIREEGPESFPLTVRVVVDGDKYFFTARCALYKNPFAGKMFHFIRDQGV